MPLLQLYDHITDELDNKKFSLGILIDLSKAFDTFNHELLTEKLNLNDIRGNTLDWFSSYLKNRLQFVKLSNIKSSTLSINCSVAQGSILGPLFYRIHL